MGIEPTSEASEASILPLYDARSSGYPFMITSKGYIRTETKGFSLTSRRSLLVCYKHQTPGPPQWEERARECGLFPFALQSIHGNFAAAFTLDGIAGPMAYLGAGHFSSGVLFKSVAPKVLSLLVITGARPVG